MFVLFLSCPLIGFLHCLRDLTKKNSAVIFVSFYALFGYCQHFQLETADIVVKARTFQHIDVTRDIIAEFREGKVTDIYNTLVCVLVRPLTPNPKIYIGIFGIVFGILCYHYFKLIYKNWTHPKNGFFFLLILLALSNISLVDFNGIRNATASMLFLCSVYRYIYCKKRIWLIGIVLSPLVHFQMWATVFIFALSQFLPMHISKWQKGIKIALVASFVASLINISDRFNSFVEENQDNIANSTIAYKANVYTNGVQHETRNRDSGTLYRQANQTFFKTFSYINRLGILVIMWIFINYVQKHTLSARELKLYSFLLPMSIFSIFFYAINYHLGYRLSNSWWELAYVFIAILYRSDTAIPIRRWIQFMSLANFSFIVYLFVNAPRLVEWTFWIFPIPFSLINGWGFTLKNMI